MYIITLLSFSFVLAQKLKLGRGTRAIATRYPVLKRLMLQITSVIIIRIWHLLHDQVGSFENRMLWKKVLKKLVFSL